MINLRKIQPRTVWNAARSTTLMLAGFACLVVAAFILHIVAGLVIAGLSCFILEWLSGDNR